MASRAPLKNDGQFKSVAIDQSLYVRNKITANGICADHIISNGLHVVGRDTVVEGLKVSGDATFCGDVKISGDTQVVDIYISGTATIAGDLFVCGNTTLNGNLFVSGNTTLQGDLLVEGTVTLNQDLYVSGNTTLNSDLFVEGNTTLNSNLFVSGNTTLNNLFVEGSATLAELLVQGNTTLQGDLLVQGDTTLQGHLFAGSGATIVGNVKISGDLSLCGDLEVSGDTLFKGDVFIDGDLGVSGNTTLYSDLLVKGDTTLSSLLVSGNTTLQGDLQVNGSVTFTNGLYVSGNTTLEDDLRVLGNTTLSGDLFVKGNSTLAQNLFVSGGATINQNLKVVGDASLCANLTVAGNVTMDSQLKVRGNASLCSDAQVGQTLTVDGNAIVLGTLRVEGNTRLNRELYVSGHVTLNSSLKVSGSATFCGDVLITGATLETEDICIMPGFTLYTNDIAPKTGTVVTVGGPGDSVMVDRLSTRYIDGKFGGSITISTSVNVIGDITATGIISSTLPESIMETNILRSLPASTTLTLGTAGAPKVVCIAEGNTLLAEHIIGKDGVGGLGLEICATTLQVEDIIPKAPNKSITLGVSTTTAIDGNLCVVGTLFGNQFSPKTGSGLTLGAGGQLVQVRDNMCVDGYLQSAQYRAKENANQFIFERINGTDRATFDISNPEFKIITPLGISLCPGNGVVQIEGDVVANNFTTIGGGPAMIMATQVVTDSLRTKSGDVLTYQNMASTDQLTFDYTSVSGPLIDGQTGALRLACTGGVVNEVHVENPMQTRRVEPDANNTRNLGTSALRYSTMFANTANAPTMRGPTGAGLTLYSDNGRILLNSAGTSVTLVTSGGPGKDLYLVPTGASVITTRDFCVGKTLAVDTIIGKNGGAVNNFCANKILVDDIETKSANILDFQTMGGTNTIRFNMGLAPGPLISAQTGQPLRINGNGNGISLEDPTQTESLMPDVTGLRDIGTSALRYNEVFGQIGDFTTHVNSPLVQNTAGALNLHASNGSFPLTRTGVGNIDVSTITRMVISNNMNGLSLVTGDVDVNKRLLVRGRTESSTIVPYDSEKTIRVIAPTLAHTGKLACFSGTLQAQVLVNKTSTDMYIEHQVSSPTTVLNIRAGTNSNYIIGNASNTVDKGSNNNGNGIFIGNNQNITGGSTRCVIIGGANHRITAGASSVVVGGTSSSLSANRGAIIGGSGNDVGGSRNCAVGSQNTMIYGNRNVVIGGNQHIVGPGELPSSVSNSFLAGGISNTFNDNVQSCGIVATENSKITRLVGGTVRYNMIAGGVGHLIRDGGAAFIGGGATCTVLNTLSVPSRAFIGGGFRNLVDGSMNAVVGGQRNKMHGTGNVVAGGFHNSVTATAQNSVIGGGRDNVIKGTALRCGMLGGQENLIKGATTNSVILGGFNCSIAHDVNTVTRSAIMGGRDTTISSNDSMVVGTLSQVTEDNNIFINAGSARLKNGAVAGTDVPQLPNIIALQAANNIHAFNDIDMEGNMVINTSDAKLKEDIEPLSLGLQHVLQMQPRQFYFKNQNLSLLHAPKRLGFIAQELETVDPVLVQRESNRRKMVAYQERVKDLADKTPLPEEMFSTDTPDSQEKFSLNYTGLIPVLTQAVKEQHVLIEQLQKRVAALEALTL